MNAAKCVLSCPRPPLFLEGRNTDWLGDPAASPSRCVQTLLQPAFKMRPGPSSWKWVALSTVGKTSVTQCGRNQSDHMWRWAESYVAAFLLGTTICSPTPDTGHTLFDLDYCLKKFVILYLTLLKFALVTVL